MKKLKAMMTIGLTLTCAALAQEPQQRALSANGWYKKGMTALQQGKPEEAKIAFENVLKLKPGFAPAKYQLSRIPELNARAKVTRRKALFRSVIIPDINFDDATLEEALAALDQFALKASNKKLAANFVIQDPTNKLQKKLVTLRMTNVPTSAALNYILDGAGAKARFDEHATVILPMAAAR